MRKLPPLLAFLIFAGCGSPPASETRVVSLTLSPAVKDNAIVIEGVTNLPDGALVAYEVRHSRYVTSGFKEGGQVEGATPVKEGRFTTSVDVRGWPAGEISVWVAFQTILGAEQQPDHVIVRYGQMREHIAGDQVTTSDAIRRVEVERTVIKRAARRLGMSFC